MHTWKIFIQSLALAGLHRGSCSVIIGAFKVLLIMLAHTANAPLLIEIASLGWVHITKNIYIYYSKSDTEAVSLEFNSYGGKDFI